MAAQKHLKATALFIVCDVLVIVLISSIADDLQADEAQRAKHECKSEITKCDPNAYCYGNDTSYQCICKFGWVGDGFVGDDRSGCQRRLLSKLRFIAYIIEIILATLMILWFLIDAILASLRAKIWNQSRIVPAQQAHPHHEVAHGPVEEV